jgi:GT2 family glycosyltransferase
VTTARPALSVVVPTHQRRESVLRLLRALTDQELPATEFEVVIAVDRSTDGTAESVDAFDAPYALRRTESPGRGRAAACNAGLAVAAGDVILFLDDDMEPAPACLRRHLELHRVESDVFAMGAAPIRVTASSSFTERFVAERFDAHLAKLERQGRPMALRDFYSGNASIRAVVLKDVGGFDESFTLYGNEDVELALRLRRNDVGTRYDSEAVASQRYTKSFRALARDSIEKGTTSVLLLRLHPEAFDELQLARFRDHSTRWRAVRALLLGPTRRRPRVAELVVGLATALERIGLGRHRLFYAFVLDYMYWAGVATALATAPRDACLDALDRSINDRAIRLLLHR